MSQMETTEVMRRPQVKTKRVPYHYALWLVLPLVIAGLGIWVVVLWGERNFPQGVLTVWQHGYISLVPFAVFDLCRLIEKKTPWYRDWHNRLVIAAAVWLLGPISLAYCLAVTRPLMEDIRERTKTRSATTEE